MKTYLALGDSMSIDTYTGQAGGGGVARFAAMLGRGWSVVDRSFDGCLMNEVDVTSPALSTALVTMTIGGNDLLGHLIANIYRPDLPLPPEVTRSLNAINTHIADNVASIRGALADVHGALAGRESDAVTPGDRAEPCGCCTHCSRLRRRRTGAPSSWRRGSIERHTNAALIQNDLNDDGPVRSSSPRPTAMA